MECLGLGCHLSLGLGHRLSLLFLNLFQLGLYVLNVKGRSHVLESSGLSDESCILGLLRTVHHGTGFGR